MNESPHVLPIARYGVSLWECVIALFVIGFGYGLSGLGLFWLCPLIFFCPLTVFLLRRGTGITKSLVLSVVCAVAISFIITFSPWLLMPPHIEAPAPRRGIGLPPALEFVVAMFVIGAFFTLSLIPIAAIWYCSHVYRESLKRKVDERID
jgi:hypothetical protein